MNGCQWRIPTKVRQFGSPSPRVRLRAAAERRRLGGGQFADRRAAADPGVAFGDLVDDLVRGRPVVAHVQQVGSDVVQLVRSAIGHDEDAELPVGGLIANHHALTTPIKVIPHHHRPAAKADRILLIVPRRARCRVAGRPAIGAVAHGLPVGHFPASPRRGPVGQSRPAAPVTLGTMPVAPSRRIL